jgi:hypothetical protein
MTIENNSEQAIIVYLDAVGLPPSIYSNYDLATLENKLMDVLKKGDLGEFDGDEFGSGEVVLYMYSNDAERMFSAVEATLKDHPLCQGARVVIRKGGPGAVERQIML